MGKPTNQKQGKCTSCKLAFVWKNKPLVRNALCPYCQMPLSQTTWSVVRRLKHGRKKPLQNNIIDDLEYENRRIIKAYDFVIQVSETKESRKKFIDSKPDPDAIKRLRHLCQVIGAYDRKETPEIMKRFNKEAPKISSTRQPFGYGNIELYYLWKALESLRWEICSGRMITSRIESYKVGQLQTMLHYLSSEEKYHLLHTLIHHLPEPILTIVCVCLIDISISLHPQFLFPSLVSHHAGGHSIRDVFGHPLQVQ